MDIKKFAIHDGSGIRTTVFLKGCRLNCWWCHNPESQSFAPHLIYREERCLADCHRCLPVCRTAAISANRDKVIFELDKCNYCGDCEKVCPAEAIDIVGRVMSVAEVMDVVSRDRIFYEEEGGGVTFSGGEPLLQPRFLLALLQACRAGGYHTAVDTCGDAPFSVFEYISGYVDLFLYDIKLAAAHRHKKYTGKDNRLIVENLHKLCLIHENVQIRLALIPGITDTDENLNQIIDLLAGLTGVRELSLLNYHRGGENKYRRLNIPLKMGDAEPLTAERLEEIRSHFQAAGLRVTTGG